MSFNTFNIVVEEETDYQEVFIRQDHLTGLPLDLTDWRAELQVRVGPDGDFSSLNALTAALVYTSDANGGIILGGTAGTIQINIAYKDTYLLNWATGDYSLILISPQGKRSLFLKGFFTVLGNASKLGTSQLTDIASGQVASPNNQGLQAQDSNTPAVPNPVAGTLPESDNRTAVEKIEDWVEAFPY